MVTKTRKEIQLDTKEVTGMDQSGQSYCHSRHGQHALPGCSLSLVQGPLASFLFSWWSTAARCRPPAFPAAELQRAAGLLPAACRRRAAPPPPTARRSSCAATCLLQQLAPTSLSTAGCHPWKKPMQLWTSILRTSLSGSDTLSQAPRRDSCTCSTS